MADLGQNKITVAANSEKHQSITGRMLKVFKSTGEFYLKFDNGDELGPVLNFDVDESKFGDVVFINKSNEDLELEYYYGDGKVTTNVISLSGAMEVINADGTKIEVLDSNTYNASETLADIRRTLQDVGDQKGKIRNPYTEIGEQFVNVFSASGVQMLINPAENINGIMLKSLCYFNNGGSWITIYNSNTAPTGHSDATRRAIATMISANGHPILENKFLPAGTGLYAASNGGGNVCNVTYDYV